MENYIIPVKVDPDMRINNDNLKFITLNKDYILNNSVSRIGSFIKKKDGVMINKSSEEFRGPGNMKQYIIWLLGNNNIGCDELLKIISEFIEGSDYMLWRGNDEKEGDKYYNLVLCKSMSVMRLEKVIIVARHGPRSPITDLPKLPRWKVGSSTEFVLTDNGKLMCYNFGKGVREFYKSILSFDKDKTIVLSTDTSRTIDSAGYFSKGLWGDDFSSLGREPVIDQKIFAEVRLTEAEHEVYVAHQKTIKSHQIEEDLIGIGDLRELNQVIKELFGFAVKAVSQYFDVFSTLKCYERERISLPGEWTDEHMLKLERVVCYYYNKLYSNGNMQKIFTDELLAYVEKFVGMDGIEMVYMSTHDSIVFPLAQRLRGDVVKLADFCSHVRFEVWDRCVRVYYDDMFLVEIARDEKFSLSKKYNEI